jgi:DNA-binding response OmpR family regulator
MSAGKTADKKWRVLVVDDDVDGAESWAELVGLWGFDVEVAHDGPSALRAAEERVPDAILLDIGLPLLDGYEVARRLRQRLGEKPFLLALTGRAQPLDRIAAAEAGINLHFAKPTDPNEILAALKQIDHHAQAHP